MRRRGGGKEGKKGREGEREGKIGRKEGRERDRQIDTDKPTNKNSKLSFLNWLRYEDSPSKDLLYMCFLYRILQTTATEMFTH